MEPGDGGGQVPHPRGSHGGGRSGPRPLRPGQRELRAALRQREHRILERAEGGHIGQGGQPAHCRRYQWQSAHHLHGRATLIADVLDQPGRLLEQPYYRTAGRGSAHILRSRRCGLSWRSARPLPEGVTIDHRPRGQVCRPRSRGPYRSGSSSGPYGRAGKRQGGA
ncbi:MAG: hypothetical protein A4E31_01310 [Methanomassiliicoccales archaeon PtaU1.Bin030]|nr:MAG: hypothetical protein A4E31_01310 [Methanomassiliicoccales archaeon PtaU1.Bin030]